MENEKRLSNDSQNIVQRDAHGRLLPGSVINPEGKQSGTIDKMKRIKVAFLDVFEATGGLEKLVVWVNKTDKNRETFYRLLLSVLPKESALELKAEFNRPFVSMSRITINNKPMELDIGEKAEERAKAKNAKKGEEPQK